MKKAICSLLLLCFLLPTISSQNKYTFEIKDGHFMLNGKPTPIISGEIHYARIPHPYWRHRLQMLKAMGLNTIATYVFWNAHEAELGKWNFEEERNLGLFLQTAHEEGLMVILRPGPYACAEWEFGGYPWWLQNIDGLELRRDNPQFLKYTDMYLKRLFQEVGKYQATAGGPIIMVQVENEFGSYASQRKDIALEEHRTYNAKIKDQLIAAGFNVPLFTSDGTWLFQGGSIEGVLPTANGEGNISNLKTAVDKYHGGKGPYMVAEFYPGWLAHWAEPHPRIEPTTIAMQAEEYLKHNISFNLYMAHGGTNFGFTSGANYNKEHDIQPDLTSYDYDAPVSEAGWQTPKYDSLRNVIKRYAPYSIPEVPKAFSLIEIPSIKMNRVTDLLGFAQKQDKTQGNKALTFEELNQGHGYVLYTRHFNQPINGVLEIAGLRDYAIVYVDGEKVGELNRYYQNYSIDIDIQFNSTLQILVESMGRINYGAEIVHNKKGIISPVKINDMEIEGNWNMYKLPMDKCPDLNNFAQSDILHITQATKTERLKGKPLVYEGSFELTETGDTFLNMSEWGKGIVFINGKNIGRYWNIGPQQTLYIPGVWLNKGVNKITVFEQKNDAFHTELKATKTPVLDDLRTQ
ncbi:MAG: hypothetical protein RL662_2158 [Bacteroidota bacterium]|jgi:beta-galactosidase